MGILRRGDAVGKEYAVKRKLGEGQFAEVYEVERLQDGLGLALKIDKKRDVKMVRQEAKILTRLDGCRQVCHLHDTGSFDGRAFFVMDLLGVNLVEMRKNSFPGEKMPLPVAKTVAASTLSALEALHAEGYVHRDIKPANIAIHPIEAPADEGTWTLIDFGLARRFCDDDNVPLPERSDAAFRGSTTYASVNSHDDRDLGRRDDLWSWFYMVVELLEGTLPWRADREAAAGGGGDASVGGGAANDVKNAAAERKRECAENPDKLFASGKCPKSFRDINNYLVRLEFTDKPKYSYLRRKVDELQIQLQGNEQAGAAAGAAGGAAGGPEAAPIAVVQPSENRPEDAAAAAVPAANGDVRAPATDRANGVGQRRSRSRSRSRSAGRGKRRSPSRASRSPGRRRRRLSSHSRSRSRSKSRSRTPPRRRSDDREARGRRDLRSSRDGADAAPLASSAQTERRHLEVLEFLAMLRAGGVSQEGATALHHLRRVQPAEAVGLTCWILDELATGLEGDHAALLVPILEELAGFATVTAARCMKKGSKR